MTLRKLFLYGNTADNFPQTSAPFVAAAGGPAARIALLFPGLPGWEPYVARYRDPWLRLGAAEVAVLMPAPDSAVLCEADRRKLRGCTGVFVAGGDTRAYYRAYGLGETADLIRSLYRQGVPYAGSSAGALIAPSHCMVWGDRLTSPTNRVCLRGSEDGCDVELTIGEGLGLLPGCLTEAHFSERGGFPRLAAGMAQTGVRQGLGIDEPICLEIQDERQVSVHGRGRAYHFGQVGSDQFTVAVYEPGHSFALQ